MPKASRRLLIQATHLQQPPFQEIGEWKPHHSRTIIFVGGRTAISRNEFFLREACSGQEHFEIPQVADRVLTETNGNTPFGPAVERARTLSGNTGRRDPADGKCETLAVCYLAFWSLFFLSCATFWSLQLTARPLQRRKSTKNWHVLRLDTDQAAAALARTGTFLPNPTFNSLISSKPSLTVAFTLSGSI